MVSHFADQFDPFAGREATSDMVSGLPRRIAQARIEAAAKLAREAIDRARTNPQDHSPSAVRSNPDAGLLRGAATPSHGGGALASGAELTIIALFLVMIAAGMLLDWMS